MLRNYFKIAIRNILRDKYYAAVNIFGLGVGMACAMVVILYVHREMSYEKNFNDHEKIYRISTKFFGIGDFAGGSQVLAFHLKEQPWVDIATRISPMGSSVIKHEEKKVTVSNIASADSAFFKVFSYPFIEGDVAAVLKRPATVVISKGIAQKLFKEESVLGKVVTLDGTKDPFEITGVFDNSDMLTHLNSEVYITDNEVSHENPWWNVGPITYIKLHEKLPKSQMEKYLKNLSKTVVFPVTAGSAESTDAEFEEWYSSGNGYRFYSYPLEDIYFDAKLKFEPFVGVDFNNVLVFTVIGLLVVIIASFNFVNLSTAKAIRRATEVGIRKTLGSGKLQLIGQFMMESMLVSLLATFVALGFAELLILLGNFVVGAALPLGVFTDKGGTALLLLFAFIVGALSAIYPAFYLTRFSPSRVIKGQYSTGKPGVLRNTLVVMQFTISIALIIASIVIYKQIDFIRNKDLGFNQNNSIIIKNLDRLSGPEELRNEIVNLSGVVAASVTDRTPGDDNDNIYSISENGQQRSFDGISGDADLIPILDLMMIEGRNFDRQRRADTAAVIMNQKAVSLLGWEDPIGKVFDERYEVIGIVSDFHFESVKNQIDPLIIFNNGMKQSMMMVKVEGNTAVGPVLQNIEKLWFKYNPDSEFDYAFLDENYAGLVEKDERQAKAIGLLTGVAITLSLLGLLGLCSYTIERKTKEIGIRKVLGATWENIVMLLSKQFVRLVVIAFIIAVPVAWYFTSLWLTNFAYHIEPEVWVFMAGAVLAIIPTWIMISLFSVSAAKANPVDSLRND